MVDKKSFFKHSRKMILIVTILVIILVSSSIYAYYWSLPPHVGPRVTLVSPPLEFSLQLEKTTFVTGENISVSISLRNISNQTVTLRWSEYGTGDSGPEGYFASSVFPADSPKRAVLDFSVLDENNTLIYGLIGRRNQAVVSRMLTAGEVVTQTFVWNQLVVDFQEYTYVPIPSGLYYMKASTLPMMVDGWEFFQQPETSSITIEILQG